MMITITVVIIVLAYKLVKAEKAYVSLTQRLRHLVEIGRLSEQDYSFATGGDSALKYTSLDKPPQSCPPQSCPPQSCPPQSCPPQSCPPQSIPLRAPVPERAADALCVMPVGKEKPEYIPVQPISAHAQSPVRNSDRGVSTINIVLVIGTLFVILSGLIFATTTWQALNNGIRSVIILALTAIFYTASVTAEKKFNLDRTSVAFFTLGSVFMPTTLVAAGFFKLFGEWFSFFGEGRYLLLGVTFAVLFGTMSAGAVKYRVKPLTLLSLCSMSASVACFALAIDGFGDIFVLIISLYAAIITVCGIFVKRIQNEWLSIFVPQWNLFSCLNLTVLSLMGIFFSGSGILPCICSALSAVLFLDRRISSRERGYGLIPFAVLSAASAYKFIAPQDASGFLFVFTAAAAAVFAAGLAGGYTERAKKLCTVISVCAMSVSLLLGLDSIINVSFTYPLLAAVIIMLGISLYYIIIEKIKPVGIAFALLSAYLFCGVASLAGIEAEYIPLFISTLVLILFAAMFFIKKLPLRSVYTDGVFCIGLTVMIPVLLTANIFSDNSMVQSAVTVIVMLETTAVLALTAFEKQLTVVGRISSLILPFNIVLITLPISRMFDFGSAGKHVPSLIIIMAVCAFACVSFVFRDKHELCRRMYVPFIAAALCSCLSMPFICIGFAAPTGFVMAYSVAFAAMLILCSVLTKDAVKKTILAAFSAVGIVLPLVTVLLSLQVTSASEELVYLIWYAAVYALWLAFHFIGGKTKKFLPLAVSFAILIVITGACGCLDNMYTYLYIPAIWAELFIISLRKDSSFSGTLAKYTAPFAGMGAVIHILINAAALDSKAGFVVWFGIFALLSLAADALSEKYTRFEGFTNVTFFYTSFAALISGVALFADAVSGMTGNRIYVIVMWAAAALTLIRILRGERKRGNLYLLLTVVIFAVFGTASFAYNGHNVVYAFYAAFACACATAFFASSAENIPMKNELRGYFSVALWAITVLTMAVNFLELPDSPLGAYVPVLAVAAAYAYLCIDGRSNFLALPVLLLGPYISYASNHYFGTDDIADLIIFILLAAAGRLVHRRVCEKKEHGIIIDWLSISAVLPALVLSFGGDSAGWRFAGSLLLAAYPMLFFKRMGSTEKSGRMLLSVTAMLSCIAWWRQPFEMPEIITLEFNFLPLCLLCLVLWHIWHEYHNVFETVGFVTAIITILHMSYDSVKYGNIVDSLILIAGVIGMLLVSFAIKKRRWFILAVVSLLGITLCMTKDFWQSLAWWAYLLIVGILLIIIAAANEMGKQKSSSDENSTKEKIRRFMEEWTW